MPRKTLRLETNRSLRKGRRLGIIDEELQAGAIEIMRRLASRMDDEGVDSALGGLYLRIAKELRLMPGVELPKAPEASGTPRTEGKGDGGDGKPARDDLAEARRAARRRGA